MSVDSLGRPLSVSYYLQNGSTVQALTPTATAGSPPPAATSTDSLGNPSSSRRLVQTNGNSAIAEVVGLATQPLASGVPVGGKARVDQHYYSVSQSKVV